MNRNLIFSILSLVLLMTNCNSVNNDNPKIIHLNSETFKKKVFNFDLYQKWKYEGNKPAIIDFYATWCGPCKQMSPIINELANEFDGKISVYKVDIDEENSIAQSFGIQNIPAFLLISMNGEPKIMQGLMPKESFVSAIDEILLKK